MAVIYIESQKTSANITFSESGKLRTKGSLTPTSKCDVAWGISGDAVGY
jgi:hypothetical protein